MKINFARLFIVIIFLMMAILGCKKDLPKVIPSISTSTPTDITSTSVICGGITSADGGAPVTSRGVCWGANQSPTISDSKTNDGKGIGSFTSSIYGLSPGGTYYARAYATNAVGIAYGNQVTLTTLSILPTITTTALSAVTSATAIGGGFITNDGGSAVTARGVCWSTLQSPTILLNSKTADGAGTGSFTSSIIGLTPGTTYYVRAYASNSIGTAYGTQISVTTGVVSVAAFTATPTTITAGQSVQFTDQSTNIPTSWCWNFGDGGTSASQNPSHTYVTAGTYTVALTSTNSFGPNTQTKTNYITVNSISGGIIFNPDLTYGSVTDIDGNIYKTILIGTQVWMAENLKTTKYRNGELIGTTTPETLDIHAESSPKYQWAYAGNESNVATYGRLYTWYAATDSRNVCPTGWHLATDSEWTTLTTFLGGESVAGGKLKEAGTSHWISPNTGATNTSGFTALPGGFRYDDGLFYVIGLNGHWWSSTETNTCDAWYRNMCWVYSTALRNIYGKTYGYSVRCVRDM